ncbi:alkaline phosphatase [Flavobacterium akiainvivens]|uniref:Alkaline phosphatase n=1 Tax=Flavobacterium akiainvivens TaxID=1202724 RepID=A0A0M8MFK6_9FLAO|nr:alkaline phosphatase D family protein [Flavobacterium akiainvivens]KOS05221.1 alkaline phosphatase [Flavobacterium akiainvivens]SFQ50509.1 alkaline phosphatase D [Flavobacterium akiainvivens]
MEQNNQSRRSFLKKSLWATGAIIIAPNFISCSDDDNTALGVNPSGFSNQHFNEGVASFDPTSSSVTIWTRYNRYNAEVIWEVSTSQSFDSIVRTGTIVTNPERDYTTAIELTGLDAAQTLYYRFMCAVDKTVSVTGETITLPQDPSSIKLAVCSCSNFQAGYFNVYEAMAESDADVIVHLGDYLYEYGAGEYGTSPENEGLNRQHKPEHEMVSLDDYRMRYRQYRGDAQLQLAHQKKPFICVWDDHEIANDAYIDGAENHTEATEGSWEVRKQNALKAYSEFIPFSRADENNNSLIYRSIKIGSLVNLIMLDTRVIARSEQLVITNYFTQTGFDAAAFQADLLSTQRTLLGNTQLSWLVNEIGSSNATWQVLGQQILMGKMMVPAELLLAFGQPGFTAILTELVTIKMRMLNNDPTLTPQEIARIQTVLPYNLDAWDGYPVDREMLYAQLNGKKLVTLAGDTHNAWHNVLKAQDGTEVGVEFATSSVSSPGFETYLGDVDAATIAAFQQSMVLLVDGLSYFDASRRGYIMATFTQTNVTSEWVFVDTILSRTFTAQTGHSVVYS